MRRLRRPFVLLGLLGTGVAVATAAPVQVTDDRGRELTLAAPPQRIVSLLPSLTETVCELQACTRLVGTDRFSNWPAAVSALPKLGGLEDSQIERIVSLKPDLVLAAVSARAIERLEALGLPVLALEPRNGAETRRVIERVALALGEPAAGAALVARIEARMVAAAARVPPGLRGRTVYFEVAANPYAAGAALGDGAGDGAALGAGAGEGDGAPLALPAGFAALVAAAGGSSSSPGNFIAQSLTQTS